MRRRLRFTLLLLVIAAIGCAAPTMASAKTEPLAIHIVGNHFVNGSGKTIRLLGVNQVGTEYACEEGYGFSDTDNTANAEAIKKWGVTAVRVPLNEDCWLGINYQPNYRPSAKDTEAQGAAAYRHFIENYVKQLNAEGIYVILDLQWTGPGTVRASGQEPMPDDHTAALWRSVATAFKSNPAVVFDIYDEPYSPIFNNLGPQTLTWSCWLAGGCQVAATEFGQELETTAGDEDADEPYTAVGMQTLIDAIRGVGADQPLIVEGLQYSQDLSEWFDNEPTDTLATPQIAASFHAYQGDGTCDDVTCWDQTVAPVAAQVPVVTGEFNEDNCSATGEVLGGGWDKSYMDWADAEGISYIAWAWSDNPKPGCYNYNLLTNKGVAAPGDGVAIRNHLQALAKADAPPVVCVVPKLSKTTLAVARKRLATAHCALGQVARPTRKKGAKPQVLVVETSNPKAGTHEQKGFKVALKMRARSA